MKQDAALPAEQSRIVVTTAHSPAPATTARAVEAAAALNAPLVERADRSITRIMALAGADRAVIVESEGLALAHSDGSTYRYHPNLGFVRALNRVRGQRDLFVEAAQLRAGDHVLDCTLGFGSEAMLAALEVNESGRVVGLESVPDLALVTREGLKSKRLDQQSLMDAMRRIEVVCADYGRYLNECADGSFDVVCFDPFFARRTQGSEININPLLRFGNPAPLAPDAVVRATAVARRRVIVKHPRSEELPDPLPALRESRVIARGKAIAYSVFIALA